MASVSGSWAGDGGETLADTLHANVVLGASVSIITAGSVEGSVRALASRAATNGGVALRWRSQTGDGSSGAETERAGIALSASVSIITSEVGSLVDGGALSGGGVTDTLQLALALGSTLNVSSAGANTCSK